MYAYISIFLCSKFHILEPTCANEHCPSNFVSTQEMQINVCMEEFTGTHVDIKSDR